MNDIQPYQFEPEGTLEQEDDSDFFEESGIIEDNREHWPVSVWTLWTNGFQKGISLLPFCGKFELYFTWFKCEMYITTSRMAEIITLRSNYNQRQSRECSYDVRAFEFPLPLFESGFRCSRNGGPPVVWIISLYLWYQVYFVIFIVECLVTVLSIIYLKNNLLRVDCPFK